MKTKKDYLKKLKSLLLWKYNTKDTADILRDYQEYFDIGEEKGKAEGDICEELGNPLLVVRSIEIENKEMGKRRFYSWKSGSRMIAVIFISVLAMLFLGELYWNYYLFPFVEYLLIIFIPCFLLGIWFALGGKVFSLDWLMEEKKSNGRKVLIWSHLILIILALNVTFCLGWTIFNTESAVRVFYEIFKGEIYQLGPFLAKIFGFTMVISSMIAFWGIYHYRERSLEYYSLFCHSMGLIYTAFAMRNILRGLDNMEGMGVHFYLSLIPYMEGLIIALLYLIYCKQVKRRKENGCTA